MFEDFACDQEAIVDRSHDSLPAANTTANPPSAVPTVWHSPQAAAATQRPTPVHHYHHNHDSQYGTESIDTLVRQMSRQTLLPYVRSDGKVRAIAHQLENSDSEWSVISPISSFSVPLQLVQPRIAPHRSSPLRQPPVVEAADNTASISQSPAKNNAAKNDEMRAAEPSWQSQSSTMQRLRESSTSPRPIREALVNSMITHGVQCNVQPPSKSLSGTGQSTESTLEPISGGCNDDELMSGTDDVSKLPVLDQDHVTLKKEKEEEALLRSMVNLRQAGTPSGIRRPRELNVRSSAETALRTRKLKRNKIKMRRRDSPKAPDLAASQMLTPPPEDDALPLVQ